MPVKDDMQDRKDMPNPRDAMGCMWWWWILIIIVIITIVWWYMSWRERPIDTMDGLRETMPMAPMPPPVPSLAPTMMPTTPVIPQIPAGSPIVPAEPVPESDQLEPSSNTGVKHSTTPPADGAALPPSTAPVPNPR